MDHFGSIFPEMVERGRPSRIRNPETTSRRSRMVFFMVILVILLGVLATRIFELTVIKGSYYRSLSQGNRVKELRIPAPRGIIYDRNGVPLVHNVPLKKETVEGTKRVYPYGETLAHVLGYTGEISERELQQMNTDEPYNTRYFSGDAIGKMGVEESFESVLRGIPGRKLTEVDASGSYVRDIGAATPVAGENIHLTLDLSLQKIATQAMQQRKGAVVASNPKTGEILSLYSSPSFDPNIFIQGIGVEDVLTHPDKLLFNRAIGGAYPPGSTYKIVTAIAALEEKVIDKDTLIEDIGVITIGPFKFHNWYFTQYGGKDGQVDIVKGMQRSNDIFFYKTGERLGITKLASWAKRLGVGSLLGIDIEGEVKGVMPDPAWRLQVRGDKWYLGDTYHVAIGQGDLLTTPLQVNAFTNIAASGTLCKPHLVKGSRTSCTDLKLQKETIDLVRDGMIAACKTGGTGWPLFNFKIPSVLNDGTVNEAIRVDGRNFLETFESTSSAKKMTEIVTACKTGTAEFGHPENKTHAWFTIYAPAYDPEISITVLIEEGGEGSSVAAPVAKAMLEEWFRGGKSNGE